ncbi:MAG: hypothetical protein K1X94_24535 [Sandaracinaceae bacterium]|nr:hypothetical protein [Sandaracinaceae bacterium]
MAGVLLVTLEASAVWWGVEQVAAIPQHLRASTATPWADAAMVLGAIGVLVTVPGTAIVVLALGGIRLRPG